MICILGLAAFIATFFVSVRVDQLLALYGFLILWQMVCNESYIYKFIKSLAESLTHFDKEDE